MCRSRSMPIPIVSSKVTSIALVAVCTVSSRLSGLATSVPMLSYFRNLLVPAAGGVVAIEQGVMADTFPHERIVVADVLAVVAAIVPAMIVQVAVGWINEN